MSAQVEYVPSGGLLVPRKGVVHREEEYPERGFALLREMQARHFWYRGRERFLIAALRRNLPGPAEQLRAIDLGCGCGGFGASLQRSGLQFGELALADSSVAALRIAGDVAPGLQRYQVDLTRLGWTKRWDVVFLLDVIEHCPDDVAVLAQAHEALTPSGIALVTVPALQRFWSWNDEAVGHQRRYSRTDLAAAAERAGFSVLDTRYFMFLLSPLLLLSRLGKPRAGDDPWKWVERTHAVPSKPVNRLLGLIFAAETPLGLWTHFPWGASALAVLQKR
jgi:SAM-dependent methyltransferase